MLKVTAFDGKKRNWFAEKDENCRTSSLSWWHKWHNWEDGDPNAPIHDNQTTSSLSAREFEFIALSEWLDCKCTCLKEHFPILPLPSPMLYGSFFRRFFPFWLFFLFFTSFLWISIAGHDKLSICAKEAKFHGDFFSCVYDIHCICRFVVHKSLT